MEHVAEKLTDNRQKIIFTGLGYRFVDLSLPVTIIIIISFYVTQYETNIFAFHAEKEEDTSSRKCN